MDPSSPRRDVALASGLRSSWRDFVDTYEPLRSDLYRYCRRLTRSPWDAEDLAQDALARAFVTLGQMGEPPSNARAWLFRVAGVLPAAPRVEPVPYREEWLLLHWYQHQDGEAVRAVTRVEPDSDRVARLRNYFFNPDFIAEVCDELGLPWRSNGYRWFLSKG
jgi:hypothetical protein